MRSISGLLLALILTILAAPALAQVYNADGQAVWPTATADTRGNLAPVRTNAVADSLVLKASAGSVYNVYMLAPSNGWLLLIDATAKPSNGAVAPMACAPVVAGKATSIAYIPIPAWATNGAVAVFSTGADCFNLTASNATFISGQMK